MPMLVKSDWTLHCSVLQLLPDWGRDQTNITIIVSNVSWIPIIRHPFRTTALRLICTAPSDHDTLTNTLLEVVHVVPKLCSSAGFGLPSLLLIDLLQLRFHHTFLAEILDSGPVFLQGTCSSNFLVVIHKQ